MREGEIPGLEPTFPNWASVEEVYLLAARTYQKNHFKTEELALVKLDQQASRSALQAESTSLYNVLRNAAMYGLAEWHGGSEFSLTILPEDSGDAWRSTFAERARQFREIIEKKIEEERVIPQVAEMEELEGKKYIITYIGPETTRMSIDSYVYNIWDPKEHEGVVLRAWGRNIRVAKIIAEELQRLEESTLKYSSTKEDIYRTDRGLAGNIYLKVEII